MNELTISIVSHGHGEMLLWLLADLDATASAAGMRVVITLNQPGEPFEAPRCRHLHLTTIRNQTPRGFGANHNAAFQSCTTRWFAVLNPDLRLQGNPFPSLLAQAAALKQPGVVAPRIVNSLGQVEDSVRLHPTPWSVAARVFSRRFGRATPAASADGGSAGCTSGFYWLAGMFMLFSAEAYRRVRGFDERFFMYYEDFDICARLHCAGFAVLSDGDALAIHDGQRASRRSARHLRWHVTSLLRVWTSQAFWATWRSQSARAK
jgi:N-acetylglucosaminyl-diphospho-decaprenol L-rhamnosyltransferase